MTKSTQNSWNYPLGYESQMTHLQQQWAQAAFSLDQAKTANSYSSQIDTNPSMQISEYISGYGSYVPKHIDSYLRPMDRIPEDKIIYPTTPQVGGVFSSCSAAYIMHMGGVYLNTRERREEFVVHLFNAHHDRKTIYFLPTTAQMKFKSQERSVLNLLFELGAVEVYTAPNNQPGHSLTNLMHLCVLNCGTDDFRERCSKYITQIRTADKYKNKLFCVVPRFVFEKMEKAEEVPFAMKGAKNPTVSFPQAVQQVTVNPLGKPRATPLRDRFGRFIKKATA